MVPASEAIKESYEHDCGPSVGKKANNIGYSLLSSLETFAQEATDNAQMTTCAATTLHTLRSKGTHQLLSASNDVLAARSKMTEAGLRLLQLAQGPQEYIPNLAVNVSCFLQMHKTTTVIDPGAIPSISAVAHKF